MDTNPCPTCKHPMPAHYDECCDDCMNPPYIHPIGYYQDGNGDDYGWQDSTFPNEY